MRQPFGSSVTPSPIGPGRSGCVARAGAIGADWPAGASGAASEDARAPEEDGQGGDEQDEEQKG